jgi:AraC family transcriptional regulator
MDANANTRKTSLLLEQARVEFCREKSLWGIMTENLLEIPFVWQRLMRSAAANYPPEQLSQAYGVCFHSKKQNTTACCSYLAALEALPATPLPGGELVQFTLPAHHYLVFHHHDHVATIRDTVSLIEEKVFPNTHFNRDVAEGIFFFESYGAGFDPRTGRGDIELWFPIYDPLVSA